MKRRAFLKLSAALAAAASLRLPRGLALASTLPLPVPHCYFPNAEALLARGWRGFDLLLLPAYAAARLIQRGLLRRVAGPSGRAHDPEGAFTIPFGAAFAALAYHGAPPAGFGDLWQRASLWPDDPRLVLGAALLRRGWSPNDSHPGHLAQIEKDLLALRPRVVTHPAALLRAGAGDAALTLSGPGTGDADPPRVAPAGRTMWIEYDWVIPASAARADEALDLIQHVRPGPAVPLPAMARLIPLTPLPARAAGHHASIWQRLRA